MFNNLLESRVGNRSFTLLLIRSFALKKRVIRMKNQRANSQPCWIGKKGNYIFTRTFKVEFCRLLVSKSDEFFLKFKRRIYLAF